MQHSIQYGGEKIVFEVRFRERKTLGITVNPDQSTIVNAPIATPIDKVFDKVRKRASWIIKQKDHFLSFEPRNLPKKYVSGETHLYLGRQYQLKVYSGENRKVKHTGRYIEVETDDKSLTQDLVEEWYLTKAKIWFTKLSVPHVDRFKKYGVQPDRLDIRKMQYRWGSCTPAGRIILNPELIKAPKACIEYVIVHELCHLVYRDHTQKFFDLQQKEFPEWQKWKRKLELLLA